MKKRIISAVISTLMILGVTAQAYDFEYYDKTKRSVSEAADAAGLSFEEYKLYMLLDEATPAWEPEHLADLKTRALPVIELSGFTVEEFKENYGLTIDIDENTIMCEIYDNMPLEYYWGDSYEEAVEYYGIADSVTPETLYGSIRLDIEKKEMDSVNRTVFTDVGYEHWAHYYITQMQKTNVIDGYDDGTYLPEKTVTRAEFAKIFAVAAAIDTESYENKYTDVSDELWYAPYVNAASDYIDAEDGLFNPEAPATREVVATAISRFLGVSEDASADLLKEKFTDANTVSEENAVYVADAVEKGIIDGFDDDTIRGNETLTRAQAATVIYRAFYEYYDVPGAFLTPVAEIGDISITLGDAIYTVGINENADINNPEVLTEELKNSVEQTAHNFAFTKIAKDDGISLGINDRRSVFSYKANMSSGIGYRKYCAYLKSQGTSMDYLTKYVENLAYGELLLEKYTEEELDKMISGVEITIYEDIIKGFKLSDFASN